MPSVSNELLLQRFGSDLICRLEDLWRSREESGTWKGLSSGVVTIEVKMWALALKENRAGQRVGAGERVGATECRGTADGGRDSGVRFGVVDEGSCARCGHIRCRVC